VPESYDAAQIAKDLGECRQRGLDWLDRRKGGRQLPVNAAALQRLAEYYVTASGLVAAGRVDQIKLLLGYGIEQYMLQGHAADANLIRDLFFGESMDGAIKPPGELLRNARIRLGDTEGRFLERRGRALSSFAQFVVGLAGTFGETPDDSIDDFSKYHQQLVITGYVDDTEHFIQMLADATRVTIVGITNEGLLPMLQEALSRKQATGRADPFWDSLRIVFLDSEMLAGINDQREEINDRREALRQRRQEAFWAQKSIGGYLKRTHSSHWTLYKTPYIPTLTGALFEFGRRKIVHLMVRRTRHPDSENLYIDLEDHEERFSAVFEDIVRHSVGNSTVPVGAPVGEDFRCDGLSLHSTVLRDGSRADGWLPMVLVVMVRDQGGGAVPILQLRTEMNSARELQRLSHLAGHIYQQDCGDPAAPRSLPNWLLSLASDIPVSAAENLVADVAAVDASGSLLPVTTGRYLYSDKERLFFFVFSLSLPEGTHFARRAELHEFPLSDLLAVRANQVLRLAARLCRSPAASERSWVAAAEVLALNLTLHDEPGIGGHLAGLVGRMADEREEAARQIERLITERTSPSLASANSEVPVLGLAGWQYREFFSQMLPMYRDLGVAGAAALSQRVESDPDKKAARERLAQLYHDEELMLMMSMEL
jgi:hypothetical protein